MYLGSRVIVFLDVGSFKAFIPKPNRASEALEEMYSVVIIRLDARKLLAPSSATFAKVSQAMENIYRCVFSGIEGAFVEHIFSRYE